MAKRMVLTITLLCMLGAGDIMAFSDKEIRQETAFGYSFPSTIATRAIQFYQRFLSPVNGDRCRMLPTCSEYAVQAIEKHGVLRGLILAADRLMREGEEIHRGMPVPTPKGFRYHDPLEANDFWMIGRSGEIPDSTRKGK